MTNGQRTIASLLAVIAVLLGGCHDPRNDIIAKVALTEANAIASAVKLYFSDTGTDIGGIYQNKNFDLDVLLLGVDQGGGPGGPYLATDLTDPWGNPYMLRAPGDVYYYFDIVSAGPDGQKGTGDDIVGGDDGSHPQRHRRDRGPAGAAG